jgi:hypothetical protein
VTLTLDRWEHILKKRLGKLDGLELAVMSAVENAEVTRRGNVPGREVHYARDLGPIALDGRGSLTLISIAELLERLHGDEVKVTMPARPERIATADLEFALA